jgi:hypothetical protein
MKLNQLVKELAKSEGKKHQASVGDIREIIAILRDKIQGDASIMAVLATPRKTKK